MEERGSGLVDDQQVSSKSVVSSENGLSRSAQTWILVGAVLSAGLLAAFTPGIMERKAAYDRIYPGCWQLVGRDDVCEMRVDTDAFLRGA